MFRSWGLGLLAYALGLSGLGCVDPASVSMARPRAIAVDGRTLHIFSRTRVPVGFLDVFAPAGDHPTTADITVGVIRSHLPVQQLVRHLEVAHEKAVRRALYELPFETMDAVRFQTCKVYLDGIGQPALTLEVAERRTSESSAATGVVWELDNLEQARGGRSLCQRWRAKLGQVWVLHRTLFPVKG